MKRIIVVFLLFMAMSSVKGQAEEFWVGTLFDGLGGSASNVMGFDWSSTGSGIAQGVGPAGTPLVVGQTFVFKYQSYLASLTAPSGQIISFPSLNTTVEYTVIAEIPEMVVSITPITPSIISTAFKTLAGSQFYIFADPLRNANVPSGFGFDDGMLVASGTFDADQFPVFTYDNATKTGFGSFLLYGTVSYVNPAYLIPGTIDKIRVEGTINYPPLDSVTTGYFAGRAGEGKLTSYTVTANDLSLKVDASSKFIPSPPPAGDCRVTAGGVKDGVTLPCTLKSNGMPDPKTCAETADDTWGGQAGAQPGIDGNWTHHHSVSPSKMFVFHSNSLFWISCSDPGCCSPACANADNKQINFAGIGRFNNQKGYAPKLPEGDVCFTVHLEDIGEPGPGGRWPSATAPCTHCPGTPIAAGDCVNCTDYYEILIYDSTAHDTAGNCMGNLIYYNGPGAPGNCSNPGDPHLFGYFTRAGNVQMHPQNN